MNRRGRRQGAPGSEDQFKRGAAATDSDTPPRERSTRDEASEIEELEAPAAQADGASEEIDAEASIEDGRESMDATAAAGVAVLERQLAEEREKYLRLAAEYDNFRKRTAKERQEAGARAQAELVRQLIDGLDDLARFAHLDPSSADAATVVHGVELVERKLLKALANAGLEVVNPLDQTFDPAHHEAVATEPALSPEDDHLVARVYQQGYLFNGQLLRPARVVVKQWNG